MPLVASTTARDVIDHIVTTLQNADSATDNVDGTHVFARVIVADDIESFQSLIDPLKGWSAGVIARPPQRGPNIDNSSDYVERLQIEVAACGLWKRPPGATERNGVAAAIQMGEYIKRALVADRTRGGLCELIEYGGQFIPGTDLNGDTRIIAPPANQSFYTVVVPVVCGWKV